MNRDAAEADTDEALLDGIQHAAFGYFRQTVNPANGLVADTTRDVAPARLALPVGELHPKHLPKGFSAFEIPQASAPLPKRV